MKISLLVSGDKNKIVLTPETVSERRITDLIADHKVESVAVMAGGEEPSHKDVLLVLTE